MSILAALLDALLMAALCGIIPFLWWFAAARRAVAFPRYVGLFLPKRRCPLWLLAVFAVIYYFFWSFDYPSLFDAASSAAIAASGSIAANAYTGLGLAALPAILLQSFLANGLGEELFFRGFLMKRFSARLGSLAGGLLQAACFGLLHNLLFLAGGVGISLQAHVTLFGFTAGAALLHAFLNEWLFNGSIWPGILLHGLVNTAANLGAAFS